MSPQKKWLPLDNASKIYPPARSSSWTALFRVSATLAEPIEPPLLEKALHRTLPRFPVFRTRLRSGLFWYYLEQIDGGPTIEPDVANPCAYMDLRKNEGYMFRVRYHEKRIAVEIFHTLTDGFGGLTFLLTLVAEYLTLRDGISIPRGGNLLDVSEDPQPDEVEDAFLRFSRPATASRKEATAYHIPGTKDDPHYLNIITGILPADRVRKVAKENGATVTEFLTALLILSIRRIQRRELQKKKRDQPIKISIPINLRQFYPTKTLRNFSSFINPGIQPYYGEYSLSETIQSVKYFIGLEGSEKRLNARFSSNVYSEKNPLIRLTPLVLKNQILRIAFRMHGDRTSSSVLTNLGNQTLPSKMQPYVERLDLMLGPSKYNPVSSALISYNNKMVIHFTRTILQTEVERNFFTALVQMGVPVKIESNAGSREKE